MNEKSLEAKLARVSAPAPDPEARLRAKRAALAEFSRVHAASAQPGAHKAGRFQGLLGAVRLSRESTSHRRDSMGWSTRTRLFAGAASVCLAVIGFAVVWPMLGGGGARLLEHTPENALPPGPVNSEPEIPARSEPIPIPRADPVNAIPEQKPAASAEPKGDRSTRAGERDAVATANSESLAQPQSAAGQAVAGDIVTAPVAPANKDEVSEVTVTGMRISAAPQTSPMAEISAKALEEVVVAEASGGGRAPHKGVAPPAPSSLYKSERKDRGVANVGTALYMSVPAPADESRDKFAHFELNPVKQVATDPVSTFSVDVDTSSYSFARRMLNDGVLPQKDAVRVEEMINYFDYAWPKPKSALEPFAPTVVVGDSPWGKDKKLVHIGIKGYEIDRGEAPDANLVLLLDVSGSMNSPDKLPLAVQSMELLLGSLKPTDTVAIVVYAGAAGTVLEPTPVREKEKILDALHSLRSGGSTAGAEGIERAYQLAERSFRKNGVNRILLATDGDFNVGIDDTEQLKGYIERKREKGIFLSVLGFGQGNYRDELAQALAQNGNGVAAYIDTVSEARKVLVQEASSSLFTIAKDVKLQVEFNPATVAEYRLVGYETRSLKREDFNNDAIDAGDVGSGHAVTAIYEITPVGSSARMVGESRYPQNRPAAAGGSREEYGYLKIRYKLPTESQSRLLEQVIPLKTTSASEAVLRDVQFSTAVAGFGQLLRGGSYTGTLGYEDIIRQAQSSTGADRFGYRGEFVQLVRKAQAAQR
ncbi:MAG TPA: von Willebrand factor type A domain-containing protein [Steroidobacteraceae bacterium]|nr:von Willebrand factor type A domain-containing protein [Steroidobacteraceae bacterium]